ncbi:ribonuclease P protein component [Stappia sp.]|uniref:ribonuclease P protein component n=1 Tax=Stappia sp. TaxID=1870903 RepID=UPI003A98D1A5
MSQTQPTAVSPSSTLPTLKKRAEFLAIAKGGRMPRRAFVLQAAPTPGPSRIGYTVTKKTGNAVERNRIRRRLRAAVREVANAARQDVSYVLVGRRGALSQDYGDLVRDVMHGLARAPLSADTSPRPHRGKPASRKGAAQPKSPKHRG